NTPAGFTAGHARSDERVDVSTLQKRERVAAHQAAGDTKDYFVWHRQDPNGGHAEKYLVDENGKLVYFVDPGINGTYNRLPNGERLTKFDAPKATLMSYIIKGILGGKLPWALVLLVAMIAIVLEMSGIPSLAFAVGVYLPLSSSSPIFIGGGVRWLVDRWIAKKYEGKNLTEEQLTAEGDKSPGVLMASGYIAGGAIAGIIIAFIAAAPALAKFNDTLDKWAKQNPFATGPSSDLLSLIPFVILLGVLYMTGREMILAHRDPKITT
ncbi:MAG: OPT/YSL family transporter, partial [Thermoanaerobaculia bacterium]